MQRVCLDRQRRNPLIDRKIRGSILLMGKLNAHQKRQILVSFFRFKPFHILSLIMDLNLDEISFKSGVGKTCSLSETCSPSTESYGRDIRLNFFLLYRVSLGEARQGECTQNFCQGWPRGDSQKSSCSSLISPL